jgi:hypothetical protein
MRPNFELLRDAFAIIDGIPKRAFDLDMWRTKGAGPSCGTIACAGGWLAMHPAMNERGLKPAEWNGQPMCESATYRQYGFTALRQFFQLNHLEGDLFEGHGCGYKDSELSGEQIKGMSGKKLFKRRVLRLFQEYDEPFDPKVGRGLLLDARHHRSNLLY